MEQQICILNQKNRKGNDEIFTAVFILVDKKKAYTLNYPFHNRNDL